MTTVLFPSYPSTPNEPDLYFEAEAEAAREAGFTVAYVDIELTFGGAVYLRRLPKEETRAIYRGWILRPVDYRRLSTTLVERGAHPVESADAYRETYEFPRWYARLRTETPRSLVILKPEGDEAWDFKAITDKVFQTFRSRLSDEDQARRQEFAEGLRKMQEEHGPCWPSLSPDGDRLMLELPGPRPVMLKDFIKSRKSEWFEACFIPDARDEAHVRKVTAAFIRLTEMADLAGGLVYREFEEFRRIGTHPKTRMPVINEWRCFMEGSYCFYRAPYWADGDYVGLDSPPDEVIQRVAKKAQGMSGFWSLDLAQRPDGSWRVIEVGSGGASGVPDGGDKLAFYQALHERLG